MTEQQLDSVLADLQGKELASRYPINNAFCDVIEAMLRNKVKLGEKDKQAYLKAKKRAGRF